MREVVGGRQFIGSRSRRSVAHEAVAFYEFTRTMQSYGSNIAKNTTLVLSTDSELFKFLKGMSPDDNVVPAQR